LLTTFIHAGAATRLSLSLALLSPSTKIRFVSALAAQLCQQRLLASLLTDAILSQIIASIQFQISQVVPVPYSLIECQHHGPDPLRAARDCKSNV
jgi:hypothetical protein